MGLDRDSVDRVEACHGRHGGGHVMDVAADALTLIVALRRFSKCFAEGKGGLSHHELASTIGLGSDALTRCLSLLTSQKLITSAVTDEDMCRRRRLFYLTRAGIERSFAKRGY
jgi:hypothetical protein